MTVTLNLRPETQAGLEVLARAAGKSVEDYLLAMVEGATVSTGTGPRSPEERAKEWIESAARHRHEAIRGLAQAEAREGLYGRSPSSADGD
jgi:hypothetical protein